MMQSIIYLLSEYEKLYSVNFNYIKGTLGIFGNDSPEEAIPFYETFDNAKFNENKYLHLCKDMLNTNNRQILYLIA